MQTEKIRRKNVKIFTGLEYYCASNHSRETIPGKPKKNGYKRFYRGRNSFSYFWNKKEKKWQTHHVRGDYSHRYLVRYVQCRVVRVPAYNNEITEALANRHGIIFVLFRSNITFSYLHKIKLSVLSLLFSCFTYIIWTLQVSIPHWGLINLTLSAEAFVRYTPNLFISILMRHTLREFDIL